MIRTPHEEPAAHGWRPMATADLVRSILARTCAGEGRRPLLIAVDGRSGGGKSTLAARLHRECSGSVVVHTDDVAWYESFFGWDELLVEGVLRLAVHGEPVRYRPPAWGRRGRAGSIEVPAGTGVLIVEGVGAGRRSLVPWIDVSIWVQSDLDDARRRGIERDGGTAEAEAFWDEWGAAEHTFLADDRPWERASFIVCGSPALADVDHDEEADVLMAVRTPTG